MLCGCRGEVTAGPSPYCADYFVYYVVVAASVWQSALERGEETQEENKSDYQLLSPYFFNLWIFMNFFPQRFQEEIFHNSDLFSQVLTIMTTENKK